jgi:hypothetical protein
MFIKNEIWVIFRYAIKIRYKDFSGRGIKKKMNTAAQQPALRALLPLPSSPGSASPSVSYSLAFSHLACAFG